MGEATRRREAAQAATEAWGRALEISPEEFDAWRDQFIGAVDITRGVLAAACGNVSIIWTLAHIYNSRTDAIDDISASVVEFAECKRGCSHCCNQLVICSPLEVFMIAGCVFHKVQCGNGPRSSSSSSRSSLSAPPTSRSAGRPAPACRAPFSVTMSAQSILCGRGPADPTLVSPQPPAPTQVARRLI
jgi:hypothetical protein